MRKEKLDYFEHFYKVSDLAYKQATYFVEVVGGFKNSLLPDNIKKMHEYEHNADRLKGEMIEQLIKDFLPPFDREDIMELADLYDSVCDSIDDVLLKFYMYDVKKCRKDVLEICERIKKITLRLRDLSSSLKGFKTPDNLLQKVVEVNDIEDEGDKLYIEATHTLFKQKVEGQNAVAWNSIYTALEECFDSCEKVADQIRNVIIKNS